MDPSTDVDDSPPKKVATSILIFDDKIYRSIIQASFSLISTKLTETSKTKKKKKKKESKRKEKKRKRVENSSCFYQIWIKQTSPWFENDRNCW